MPQNAAGLDVSGSRNPRWKGGLLDKVCAQCGIAFQVKRASYDAKFCSLACVGLSQRGKSSNRAPTAVTKLCEECGAHFTVPRAHAARLKCCSNECGFKRRARVSSGAGNANWQGGLSRLPYPYDFAATSKRIIARDVSKCQNPKCLGRDPRLTTHHINYDKQDCSDGNLIALCSACNSRANFGRGDWQTFYTAMLVERRVTA